MPELLEVESYTEAVSRLVGCHAVAVDVHSSFVSGGLGAEAVESAILGHHLEGVARLGKVLIMSFGSGADVALRFGMTGRVRVDDFEPIARLMYSSQGERPQWQRMRISFADSVGATHELVVIDQRGLGSIELAFDGSRLGPDATSISISDLDSVLRGRVAIKTRLLDQERISGIGNLLADDMLWRAAISPLRHAESITHGEKLRFIEAVGQSLSDLRSRGGSHMGELQPLRSVLGSCPSCGGPLRRDRVGGRSTVWCGEHQR